MKCKCFQRRRVINHIRKQLDMVNQMGRYRFIGYWGENVLRRYNRYIDRYNKIRFCWQRPKRLQ